MSQSPRRSARILVIEDTRPIAQLTQQMLQSEGHEVEIAFDGASGIETARRFRPDVVLCDLCLPEMTGYDVLRSLQAEAELNDTIFVAVTGYSDEEDKQRTAEAGFHAHLVKPVGAESLLKTIEQLPCGSGKEARIGLQSEKT